MFLSIKKRIHARAVEEKTKEYSRFFVRGKGYYSEGDIFWAFMVPVIRKVVKNLENIPLSLIKKLISSTYYEERLSGVLILLEKTKKTNEKDFGEIFSFYLKNFEDIKNWDIIHLSAPMVIGRYLYEYNKNKDILHEYAKSENVKKRHLALLSTYWFVKQKSYDDALAILEILITDENIEIQKSIGDILSEVGKRSREVEGLFLSTHCKYMHRIALRKATYMFTENERMKYIKCNIL